MNRIKLMLDVDAESLGTGYCICHSVMNILNQAYSLGLTWLYT